MPHARTPRRVGFTLVELLVVIAIMGIIIALILVAASDGVRRAEERQTQTLITKLEAALTDRVDALLAMTPPLNQTHRYLGALTENVSAANFNNIIPNSDGRRAQVIAQLDFMKAELPDVFFVNPSPYFAPTAAAGQRGYPLNFAAAPYPLNATNFNAFALPLGNRNPGAPITPSTSATNPLVPTPGFDIATGFNDVGVAPPPAQLVIAPDSGIFGASFTAAAGVTKNLYEAAALDLINDPNTAAGTQVNTKAGYDAADNDGNGLVDNIDEVTVTPAPSKPFAAYVADRLARHTHATARSETLYGLLVEGQGPLGSVYNRDDFTNREVGDTDGDGMLEFLDAWGQPLQFYRWPIFFGTTPGSSDSQKGYSSYGGTEPRQQDPLDPNQLLVAPAWWSGNANINAGMPSMLPTGFIPDFSQALNVIGPTGGKIFINSPASQQANALMAYSHILIDPNPLPAQPPINNWDRSGTSLRRAYYSKFLVLSGGPDKVPGTFQLNFDYTQYQDSFAVNPTLYAGAKAFPTGLGVVADAMLLNWCESQAAQVDFTARSGTFLQGISSTTTSTFLQGAGLDDITNHTLTGPGAGAK